MLILTSPADISRISNSSVRALVELRFKQLGRFDAGDGLLIVVEAGDNIDELERVSGCALLRDPFEDVAFGHPDFTSLFDYVEKHNENGKLYCYEAHVDTGDAGIGTTFFIPAETGISGDLLAMCAQFSISATDPIQT